MTGGLALPGRAGAAAVATGLFATALAFVAMVWAQRIVSPSRAALVLLLEPVFAAALSWAAGDELGPGTAAGGALILLAVAVAEVGPAAIARWRPPPAGTTGPWPPVDGPADPRHTPDQRETGSVLTIHESARLVGAYAWVEMRLFEVLGAWVATVPEAPVQAALAVHSRHHAWHAELWHGHLPHIAGQDPDQYVAPPADEVVAALDAVAEPEATLDRLVGAYRVALPHLVTTCSRHLELASPLADPPVARTLRIVLGDLIDDWREGEALVQAVRRGAADIERTALHQARIETLLAAGGGLAGPATPRVDR